MKILFKIFKVVLKILLILIPVLFVVYFLNLDQKVMAVLYKIMNQVFDRKKADIKF